MPVCWKDKYATGEETIDGQHQQLFQQLNLLETQLGRDELDASIVTNTIQFLKTFARSHFVYEEFCMFRHKCEVNEQNQIAHDKFMQVAEELSQQLAARGVTHELVERTHKTITDWLIGHICKIDTQLRPCLAAAAG